MSERTNSSARPLPERAPQIESPGFGELREAVVNRLRRRLPPRSSLSRDGVAGLNVAIANVPDGMANGFLVGVNPVYGLYATMVGPLVGGILSSTQLMVISTTAAASLTSSQALAGIAPADRGNALFVLVIFVGLLQMLAGALRLGQLTRFVSFSVTTGLLAGISVLLVLSQLPTMAGYEATGSNRVTQTLDLLAHLGRTHLPTLLTGLLALVLATGLPRTRLKNAGRLTAIIVPSVLVTLPGMGGVRTVSDVSEIPGGFPSPSVPSFLDAFDVITGAISVAIVILVQGVGVSQSVPNLDGSRSSVSRDFLAQGAANVASGFFRGLPVGGSLSTTALNVLSGAVTRWAAMFAGLWMAVIVIVVPGLVGYVAMPALGALLILAGLGSLKPRELVALWHTGWPSRLAAVTTFLCTLLLPIQAAVGIGVVLSALLYVNESSMDIVLVEQVERPDGLIEERTPPTRLPSNAVTVLDVYGHLFYAGAGMLEERLPTPRGAEHPVVVLRLRGHGMLGATVIDVLAQYAEALRQADGRLYLSGIAPNTLRQVVRSGKLRLAGPVRAFPATSVLGESTRKAVADAEYWLATTRGDERTHDQDP